MRIGQTYRKRCKRYDIAGQAHCLTFSCFANNPFLSHEPCCHWLAEALVQARERRLFELWAYVFMPEHVHLVLLPSPGVTVSRILTAVKASTAKRAIFRLGLSNPGLLAKMADIQPNGKQSYRFWQRGGGYDRNLRNIEDIYEKMHYIHANPVRRHLVDTPDQWYWSSHRAWQTGTDSPIPIDRGSLQG